MDWLSQNRSLGSDAIVLSVSKYKVKFNVHDFAHWNRCLNLRMPSLSPLLYLAYFTERRPRDDREKSESPSRTRYEPVTNKVRSLVRTRHT